MSTWIEVNGAKVEKQFFDENVREAKGYAWNQLPQGALTEHTHCMICGVTIDSASSAVTSAYKSKGGYLCSYCHDHFLNK